MGEERDRQGGGATGYLIVTAAYWAFTLTDGALRTLVLLHLHGLGYAPFEIASRPVTAGEYREFIADDGYERSDLWLADGWDLVQREGWQRVFMEDERRLVDAV